MSNRAASPANGLSLALVDDSPVAAVGVPFRRRNSHLTMPLRHPTKLFPIAPALLAVWGALALMDGPAARAADAVFFETRIRPVLHEHCVECHGAEKQKGGLRLDSRAGLPFGLRWNVSQASASCVGCLSALCMSTSGSSRHWYGCSMAAVAFAAICPPVRITHSRPCEVTVPSGEAG